MAALSVSSGAETQRLKRPGIHGVFPLLMGVSVLSKFDEAMLGEIDKLASDHSLCDQNSGDDVLIKEAVEPERHETNKIAHKDT